MIAPPTGARIWIAAGITDLRRGFTGLSAAVQTVLEAYVKWNGNPPAKTSKEIGDLTRLTNAIRHMLGTPAQAILRNSNGVYMKLMNFRRLDPAFTGQGKSGLVRGNKLEEEVWRDFYPDPVRLSRVAAAIRATIQAGLSKDPAFMDDSDSEEEMEAVEGRIMTVLHRLRERSKDLVAKRNHSSMGLRRPNICPQRISSVSSKGRIRRPLPVLLDSTAIRTG